MKQGTYTCPACNAQTPMGVLDDVNPNKLLTTTYCSKMDSGLVTRLGVDPLPQAITLVDYVPPAPKP